MRKVVLKHKDDSVTTGIQENTISDKDIIRGKEKRRRHALLSSLQTNISKPFLWIILLVVVYILCSEVYMGTISTTRRQYLQSTQYSSEHEKHSLYPGDEIDYPVTARKNIITTNTENKKVEIYDTIFESIPAPDNTFFEGKGIVIAASGQYLRHLVGTYVTVHNIRKVWKSNLPIEVFYSGTEEKFSMFYAKYFQDLGNVKLINLEKASKRLGSLLEQGENINNIGNVENEEIRTPYSRPYLHPTVKMLKSFASKAYAMYASSFKEVILFDAGVVLFQPPEAFFEIEGYTRDGFVLFRDYASMFSASEKVRFSSFIHNL